ncbi:MAG: chlorite dismutase family protein, partial [Deltaproteobacteria bacterium]|nr:chlorite dismutase family protein [Deltaproteobacteria bacterium]
TNADWPWALWYPLRRKGEFALLPKREQGMILMEHGVIGRAFGGADLGHDIRLTCNGLDKNDNDFVIALIGKDLFPLSKLVETMRGTKQTSTYIEEMGPFFIGRAIYQSK